MKRLFIAIKLTPNANVLGVYNYLRKELSYNKIRWVEPGNFHLTLKFIGETQESKIPYIIEIIKNAIGNYDIMKLNINKIGIFGSSYKPRIIWFGIAKNKKIDNLANDLINNLDAVGFVKDNQNFIPHFTIGRITNIIDKKVFNSIIDEKQSIILQQAEVKEVILYESIQTHKNICYNEIFCFSLTKEIT
jgi:2'-5' RNA ligase